MGDDAETELVANMITSPQQMEIQIWYIERLVFYARNPRKNDSAVDRMCGSIREFGFKVRVLARSDGEVVDGHLRLKAARKLGITEVPVILCDEWSEAQVKAFRLIVNRSVAWSRQARSGVPPPLRRTPRCTRTFVVAVAGAVCGSRSRRGHLAAGSGR